METLIETSYLALHNYFLSLLTLGYVKYSSVNKLILLLYILELIDNCYAKYLTEDDYKTLYEILYCLYGDCLIPYPNYLGVELTCK